MGRTPHGASSWPGLKSVHVYSNYYYHSGIGSVVRRRRLFLLPSWQTLKASLGIPCRARVGCQAGLQRLPSPFPSHPDWVSSLNMRASFAQVPHVPPPQVDAHLAFMRLSGHGAILLQSDPIRLQQCPLPTEAVTPGASAAGGKPGNTPPMVSGSSRTTRTAVAAVFRRLSSPPGCGTVR